MVRVRGSRLRWWAAKGGERSRGGETSRREIASRGRRVRGWHSCVLARGFEISSVGLRGGVGAYLRASPWRRPSGVVRQGIVEDCIGTIPGGICVEEDRGRRRQRAVAGGDSRVFFSGEPSSVGSRDWGMAGAGGNLQDFRTRSGRTDRTTAIRFGHVAARNLRHARVGSAGASALPRGGGSARPPRKQQRLVTPPTRTPRGPAGDCSRTETTVLWTERDDRGARARAQRVDRARDAPAGSEPGRPAKRNVSWRTLKTRLAIFGRRTRVVFS